MPASWTPLLQGSAQERGLAVVHEIGAAVEDAVDGSGPSLAQGRAGLAIFFAYLDRAAPDRGYADISARCLESAFAVIGRLKMPGLYGGIAGVGFAIQHLSDAFDVDEGEDDDPLQPVDEWIERRLTSDAALAEEAEEYDLINGWVGVGVYALERAHRPLPRACLGNIVRTLERLSEERDGGLAWHHDVSLLPDFQRERYPQGWYNLGMAHGMPGIIGLLAEACRLEVEPEAGARLLDGAIAWLLKQHGPGGFPAMLAPGEPPVPTRSAWCYGDPGVALALINAARAMNRPDWEEVARNLALGTMNRSEEALGVVDAGLCHGAIGLAHIFNRFFHACGDPTYAEFARRWIDRTLEMRRPGVPVAGFPSYFPNTPGRPARSDPWIADAGLLTGACGVGLGLLAACTAIEPRWDRVLLSSLPMPVSEG